MERMTVLGSLPKATALHNYMGISAAISDSRELVKTLPACLPVSLDRLISLGAGGGKQVDADSAGACAGGGCGFGRRPKSNLFPAQLPLRSCPSTGLWKASLELISCS